MLFLKSSFILFFSISAFAANVSSKDCVKSDFQTAVTHEGKFFGLIKNDLAIVKKQCQINITYKKILETEWEVDICREPIHMKVTSKASQSVYKRKGTCDAKESDYCHYLEDLITIIQDHGLIFAEGDREDFSSSHGQTYCTYMLLKRYLVEGRLFSKYDDNVRVFDSTSNQTSRPVLKKSVPKASVSVKLAPEPSVKKIPASEFDEELEPVEKNSSDTGSSKLEEPEFKF